MFRRVRSYPKIEVKRRGNVANISFSQDFWTCGDLIRYLGRRRLDGTVFVSGDQGQDVDASTDVYETEIRLTLANDTANTSQLQWVA